MVSFGRWLVVASHSQALPRQLCRTMTLGDVPRPFGDEHEASERFDGAVARDHPA